MYLDRLSALPLKNKNKTGKKAMECHEKAMYYIKINYYSAFAIYNVTK